MIEIELSGDEEAIVEELDVVSAIKIALRTADRDGESSEKIKETVREIIKKAARAKIMSKIKDDFDAVIGCGSMGSYLVDFIARTRPDRRLLLVDFDVVEARNLAKQLFFKGDIGKHKAEVLGRRYSKAYAIARAEELFEVLTKAYKIYITSDKGSAYVIANKLITRGFAPLNIVIAQSDKGVITYGTAAGPIFEQASNSSGWNNEGYDEGHSLKDTLFAITAISTTDLNFPKMPILTTIEEPTIVSEKKLRLLKREINDL